MAGRGEAITHAGSGIEIIFWDILGGVTKQLICWLLGGRYRDRIKPCGFMFVGGIRIKCDRSLMMVLHVVFERSRSNEVSVGGGTRRLTKRLCSLPVRCSGPDVELMIDTGGSDAFWPHGYKWAWNTAKMLADYEMVLV
ncbi:MAG: hypothetical protein M2R45_03358 [Verrucomicrobia subdivision 3 bacterium]|nr:hypothetical protein [Limisphaerales bacterium]MCS1416729.1 hypothetical protein [Limisphaerales bacterium]